MSGPKIESFDVSQKMRNIIEWRHARRKQLREQYLREILKPTKLKLPVDTAMQRYCNARLMQEFQTKVEGKGHGYFIVGFLTIIIGTMLLAKRSKDKEEHMYRTGQISYVDRNGKFV
ncbi:hypothetical protein WH47_10839 [Habropoda laboriosa]|uniref:NADH dehydrogenase [ubiquinone] 1 beta subcomplex subunit 4 n=1 Tax=Habropoda laboriosa TaxID=597456 RepID=A0A0L7RDP2_9HYME|nr:PREDICTED: uncharacterized protein LOC108579421 [Habropoda laboriosa]KOC68851.1 hypothetical protein WH47_10839 [Habropoda laboriosa]